MPSIIIDTDPGIDDVTALLMALRSPDLTILGITTVGGNARLAHTTRNTLRILEYAGRPDIPVFKGSARPLRGTFSYAYHFHGPAGLTARLPLPRTSSSPLSAVDFLAKALRDAPGQVTLVTLGPLTNIARLLQQRPAVSGWIKELVVMGGLFTASGNSGPLKTAEFNVYNDPEAAQLVLSAGIPTTVVPLDVCHRVVLRGPAQIAYLGRGGPEARLVHRLLVNWFRLHPGDTLHLCDPLAMARAIRPSLLTYRTTPASVVTERGPHRGETRLGGSGPPVRIAVEVDVDGFLSLLDTLLAAQKLNIDRSKSLR